jgi:hypothetical protein
VAKGCFNKIEQHVFVGGFKSGSGAHLASGVLRSDPTKAGQVDAQTLIMKAAITVRVSPFPRDVTKG